MDLEQYYTWSLDSFFILLRYFLFAGIGYLIFYQWMKNKFTPNKIQKQFPSTHIISKEILYSTCTLLIFCGVSWTIFEFYKMGITKIYPDVHQYGYYYFFFSILLMILIHDTYFYWTHRFLHIKFIFKLVHKTHHQSHNPTPWAAFSFHPIEAVIAAGVLPIIVLLIPSHPFAIFTFLTYMALINVIGHLGFEIFPLKIRNSKFGRWHNYSTNHNFHHQYSKNNYGLYFSIWDRLMGTYSKP